MKVSQSHGVRRVAEIAAKVARCRAALPVVTSAPESNAAATVAEVEPRAPWVSLYPRHRDEHLRAQRRMFAAIKSANLPLAMSLRLNGINAFLGTAFTSSTQLSPAQLHAVADAIESGRFAADWTLDVATCDNDAPLPDAPPETDDAPESVGTPAPLESLDEIAMEFDLDQMRRANRARALNALRSERITLAARLCEVDRAILCA